MSQDTAGRARWRRRKLSAGIALSGVSVIALIAGMGGSAMAGDTVVAGDNGRPECGGKKGEFIGDGGPNLIVGTSNRDVIIGRAGDDTLKGRGGNDLICGGRGDDTLRGQAGRDGARGDRGDDEVRGNNGRDVLEGNLGDDRLKGGDGRDFCNGGKGFDVFASCERGPDGG